VIPNNTQPYSDYVGDGTLNVYQITFPTFENTSIIAWIESPTGDIYDLDETDDYQLANIGRPNYLATLTLVDDGQPWLESGNLAENFLLMISFNPFVSQPVRLRDLGNYSPEAIERSMDRAVMGVLATARYSQQLREYVDEQIALIEQEIADGGGTPPPTNPGDFLDLDGDLKPQWNDGTFGGFSARFGQVIEADSVRELLLKIVDYSYLAPLLNFTASGSGTIREKGTAVTASTLTANVTKRTDDIARIRFLLNMVEIANFEPPTITGSGATTFNWTGSFSDNVTFRCEITDDGDSGGPTTVGSNVTFNFVYPYYFGSDVPGITAAAVAGLTKNVIASSANVNRTFVHAGGDVFYFAYPASYGALTSILDQNGFETIGSWTLRTENITGLDGNPVSYRIYEFNNVQAAGTSSFTFIR